MVIFNDHRWQQSSEFPDTNFIPQGETQPQWIVDDNSDLAKKIMSTPLWTSKEDSEGNLIDIVATPINISEGGELDTVDTLDTLEYKVAALISQVNILEDQILSTKLSQGLHITSNPFTITFDSGQVPPEVSIKGDYDFKDGKIDLNSESEDSEISLLSPYKSATKISACRIVLVGTFTEGTTVKYEVTNSADNEQPVWEDCTEVISHDLSTMISNRHIDSGKSWAFNFRITVSGGSASISSISCFYGGYFDDL